MSSKVIEAIAPGPYAVGSSNLEVSTPAAPMIDYLKGAWRDGQMFYLADILKHPKAALNFEADLPTEPVMPFGVFEGKPLPIALYVLYPTSPDNPRANYTFPYAETADNVLPHMQSATDKPLFAKDKAKYPLIVFSHGYEGHGLWDLDHMKVLAANGYIVACVFYGDGRANGPGNFGMRPFALSQTLDYLLAHPDYRDAIDRDRIGISGSSFGGYTVLTALGAKRGFDAPSQPDARVKAGFVTVPAILIWDGTRYIREDGLSTVSKPLFVVYGGKDEAVSSEAIEAAVQKGAGPVAAVRFDQEPHILSKEAWPLVQTWEVLFFDAWLKGDAVARTKLYGADTVAGAAPNRKTWQHGVEN